MLHSEDEELFFFFYSSLWNTDFIKVIYDLFGFLWFPMPDFGIFHKKCQIGAIMQIWSLKHEKFPKFSEDFACLWRNNSFCEKWIGVIQLEKCQVFDMKENGSLWRIRGQFWWSLVNSLFFSHILLNHSLLVAKGPTFVLITSDFKRLPFKN